MRDICQDLDFTLVVEGIENQQQLQGSSSLAAPSDRAPHLPPLPGVDIPPAGSDGHHAPDVNPS